MRRDANFTLELSSRTQFAKIKNIKVIAKNQCEKHNKRALGPWVPHLRMTVYKGIGEQSSSQSPATCLNFDILAVSLRLNMGYVDKINRMYNFNKGNNLNKLGRGSQDDAMNIISRL